MELHLDSAAWAVPPIYLPADLPLSGLDGWLLTGALHSNQAQRSLALISIDGAAPLAVKVGDNIYAGIQLVAVYADHVQLRRGLHSARLNLQGSSPITTNNRRELASQAAPMPPSTACTEFIVAKVPAEELVTLGICPPGADQP